LISVVHSIDKRFIKKKIRRNQTTFSDLIFANFLPKSPSIIQKNSNKYGPVWVEKALERGSSNA